MFLTIVILIDMRFSSIEITAIIALELDLIAHHPFSFKCCTLTGCPFVSSVKTYEQQLHTSTI